MNVSTPQRGVGMQQNRAGTAVPTRFCSIRSHAAPRERYPIMIFSSGYLEALRALP